jgi:hypothetical protein
MTRVEIDVDDPETLALWEAVRELVARLPGDWVLIGGLMAQLHALRHKDREVRVTIDIDVLGQARPPGALQAIDEALCADGFELVGPDLDGYAHRYRRAGLVLDVLAPEGIKAAAMIGGHKAVGVPGGTQALRRAETVTVSVGGREFALRRPTLLGAIVIKARSLMKHSDTESQREDLLRLWGWSMIRVLSPSSCVPLSAGGSATPRSASRLTRSAPWTMRRYVGRVRPSEWCPVQIDPCS